MPLTTEQRVEIALLSGRDGATNRSVAEQFNRNHPHENVSHTSVSRLINKFRETGSVIDKKRSGRPGLSAETRAQVLEKIASSPRKSISAKSIKRNWCSSFNDAEGPQSRRVVLLMLVFKLMVMPIY